VLLELKLELDSLLELDLLLELEIELVSGSSELDSLLGLDTLLELDSEDDSLEVEELDFELELCELCDELDIAPRYTVKSKLPVPFQTTVTGLPPAVMIVLSPITVNVYSCPPPMSNTN